MRYSFGTYILNTHKKIITLKENDQLVTNNERMIDALILMLDVYPETVSKSEFIDKLWPNSSVTEWALSRLIADIRQLFSNQDPESAIIKTVHGKGFRLGVQVGVLPEENTTESDNHTQKNDIRKTVISTDKKIKIIALLVFTITIIVAIVLYTHNQNDSWKSTEQLASTSDYEAPDKGWWSNIDNSIQYKNGHIILSPTETQQKFSFIFDKPTFIQNATLYITLKADSTFVNSHSVVQPFAQVIGRGNWMGEWHCPKVEAAELSEEYITISCVINSPSEFWKQEKNESSQFGLIVTGDNIQGNIEIKSAKIHFPINVNLDHEWKKPAVYDRGVKYFPTTTNDGMSRSFIGPVDLREKTLIFTLQPDKEFIQSGASIQPFLYKVNEHNGMWNCLIDNKQLRSSGFSFECPMLENKDIYLFGEDDYLIIGVQPFGDNILGEIKIIGISILSKEEMKMRNNSQHIKLIKDS